MHGPLRHIQSGMKPLHTMSVLFTSLVVACSGEQAVKTSAGGAVAGCESRAYQNVGGPFTLVNTDGETVTQDDFKGKPSLVFFGFTYCPDICPGTMLSIANAYRALPDDIEPPQTIMISIDPERDTPEALGRYVSSNGFPDSVIGLTGTPEQVQAAADEFYVGFDRVETPESQGEYTMNHTTLLYLMDEDWQLKTFFTHEDTAETISACLGEILQD